MNKKKNGIKNVSKDTTTTINYISPKQGTSSYSTNFWLQSFFLAFICFIFYSNTFRNGYAVDDFLVIDQNKAINSGFAGIPKILSSDIFESYYERNNANNRLQGGRYRPLALVTYTIEQQFFGQTSNELEKSTLTDDDNLVKIRHVNNVLLYILSVIALLYFLQKVVFPTNQLVAFLSVLIFAIHPIHTEVVANIKSRDEILSLLFITLTLINVATYVEKRKLSQLLFGCLFFFLALLSKEYAISLIVLIPLMLYLFKNLSILNSIKAVLPYIGIFGLYLFIRHSFVPFSAGHLEQDLLNNPYLFASETQKIASEIANLLQYVKLLVFPHPLSVDYSYNQIPYSSLSDLIVCLSIFFHLLLIVSLVILTKRKNVLAFAIAIYGINLLLVSNLLFDIGATIGERLIYHSSLGFSIAIAYLIHWGYKKINSGFIAKSSLIALMFLLVILTGMKTIARNKDWESNSTLYRKDVLATGKSAVSNANAGNAYLQLATSEIEAITKKELLNKAKFYLNKAITIHPGYTLAYINRGNVFFQSGNLDLAKKDWDTAKKQYPTHPELPGLYASYYINYSVNKYGSKGKYEEAIIELKKGAALDPKNLILLFNLGYYYNLVGKKESAIKTFQKIISINPTDTLAIKCVSYIEILKKAP